MKPFHSYKFRVAWNFGWIWRIRNITILLKVYLSSIIRSLTDIHINCILFLFKLRGDSFGNTKKKTLKIFFIYIVFINNYSFFSISEPYFEWNRGESQLGVLQKRVKCLYFNNVKLWYTGISNLHNESTRRNNYEFSSNLPKTASLCLGRIYFFQK